MPKTPRQSYSPTCMAEGCKCSASADQKCSAYRRIQGLAKFSVVVVVRSLFVKVYRKVLNAVLLLPHLLIGNSSSSALLFSFEVCNKHVNVQDPVEEVFYGSSLRGLWRSELPFAKNGSGSPGHRLCPCKCSEPLSGQILPMQKGS